MGRSQLKNKASKSKYQSDILKYKSQLNFVVKANRKVKINYFDNTETGKSFKLVSKVKGQQ